MTVEKNKSSVTERQWDGFRAAVVGGMTIRDAANSVSYPVKKDVYRPDLLAAKERDIPPQDWTHKFEDVRLKPYRGKTLNCWPPVDLAHFFGTNLREHYSAFGVSAGGDWV